MKNFSEWLSESEQLDEAGFFRGLVDKTKNLLGFNQQPADPNVPRSGDALKIFNLYKGNGTYLVSDTTEGNLLINKDGSVSIQFQMGNAMKIANNIQQAKLEPNGRRSWKINRYMD
jgi:hypothetical protein